MLTLEGLATSSGIADGNLKIMSCGDENPLKDVTDPVILAVNDLLPSQTLLLDKSKILAFVLKKGSYNSHASILARSLGIPAVSALGDGFEQLKNGQFVIVDGIDGCVVCEPDCLIFAQYKERRNLLNKEERRLQDLLGTPSVTKDGFRVEICANISRPEEVSSALEHDAEGIGLLRSEFLYMENSGFPSEEVQFKAYRQVLEAMSPRRVVVRTLDLGADKQATYFNLSPEENPALGYRAIRICLDRTEIFIPQLRALLRASIYGRLAIMFPMITSVDEVQSIYHIINNVKLDLTAEGILFSDDIEFGIMIETPAAAMIADRLAREVDFFSIGTNDLTQYTLAVDRMNTKINYLFDSGNTAVLRMIRYVAESAHKNGVWVEICGESAANLKLIPYYVAMGIDELSVSPNDILKVKEKIQSLEKQDCTFLCNEFLD